MSNITKWAVIMPAAALMTAGLFAGMRGLIAGEWQPQEKSKATKFEINPVVEDIKVIETRTKLAKLKQVKTPPPPPMIDRAVADLPSEPIADLPGKIPAFEPPVIDRTTFNIDMSDRDVQPLVRIPPVAPSRFLEGNHSGHCKVRFDVSPEGSPYNVNAYACTTQVLAKATTKSVRKWRFNPKISGGRPVAMRGVENKVTFNLLDERGNLLPEPGY